MVFQVKWAKAAPSNPVTWLESAVKGEADKIDALVQAGATRYVLMTSVSGTAAKGGVGGKGAGTIDRFDDTLEAFRRRFGLNSMECWWRDDVDTRVNLLDTSTLLHFAAMLSGADALRLLAEGQHEAEVQNDLASLLRRVISAQWTQDSKVKFKQAELDNDSLHALFIDVRATATPPSGVQYGGVPTERSREARPVGGAVAYLAGSSLPFTLVRGEPGQGKSTMGQYLAQVYRAQFIGDDDAQLATDRPSLTPSAGRLPVRIELRDYAAWLNGDDPFTLEPGGRTTKPKQRVRGDVERFLQVLLAELAATDPLPLDMVHEILDRFPVALIFDGLDEIGQPAVRARVVTEITGFVGRYRRGAAMTPKLIVTTRPNVSDLAEPSQDVFELLVLDRLDDRLRTDYLRKWCDARGIDKRDRRELMRTFNTRKVEPHIAQLTGNPMQLTILLYLLHRQGRSVPDRRTPLYDEYMKTSLAREADKTPSVQANRDDLEEVVAFLGWHVQATAEQHNSAGRVPTPRLRSRIFEYLDTNGKDTGLVDALFTDVTDRVWVLTSKAQGTFEFDVQPVREFFAAKYLDHYANEDKARILAELISRPFWFNTSRFFAGFATPNEVSGLVDGLADTLAAAQQPLSDRVSVWTLLADGVFAQRARAQHRAVELLTDDLSVRLLTLAGDDNDPLPAMPADRGAAMYCQALVDVVAADPAAPLASERVALAIALAVESPPLGQWWLEHAQPAFGTALEDAWLQIAVPLAAGRLLTHDRAATLTLDSDATACTAVAAGVAPAHGSATEARLLRAVLDGHCSDVAAPNPGLLADLTNVFAPREFIALFKGIGRAPYEMATTHCSEALAPERRRDAFRRLNIVNAELGKAQAAMNRARRANTSVAAWSACADHLRAAYGPCWLAADIAIIGAAINPERRRDTGPWNPTRTPFGEHIDYGRLVNDIRQHRNDAVWWRKQRDTLPPTARDLWIYALLAVAHADVVSDCLHLMAADLDHLPDGQLAPLMASSSRLGLSGISRRLPGDLPVGAVATSLSLALLLAHHADRLSGMRSNLADTFTAQQAADAAAYGTAAWPALRAVGTKLSDAAQSDTASTGWLDVLAAHDPHARAGVATGPLDPDLVTRIIDTPAAYPLQWLQVAEHSRSLATDQPPLADIGTDWFDD